MTPKELCAEATRRGIRLDVHAGKISVVSSELCPEDFADILRAHKPELLSWLEGKAAGLGEDERPWLHVARQVLGGEFECCCRSMRESLTIGLRSIRHPDCQRALERLNPKNPL